MTWTREDAKAYNASYYVKNKKQMTERMRGWRRSPAGIAYQKQRLASEEYRKEKKLYDGSPRGHHSKYRTNLKRRYKISQDAHEKMLKAQGGLCAICKGVNRSGRRLHVDHDHKTGAVRELLCGLCNTMLGHARDNVTILGKAIKYLDKHRERE